MGRCVIFHYYKIWTYTRSGQVLIWPVSKVSSEVWPHVHSWSELPWRTGLYFKLHNYGHSNEIVCFWSPPASILGTNRKIIIVCACAVAQYWITWESRRDIDPECSVLSESITSVWWQILKRFHQRIRAQPFFTRVCCQALLAMSEALFQWSMLKALWTAMLEKPKSSSTR